MMVYRRWKFIGSLGLAASLLMSCTYPLIAWPVAVPDKAVLEVEINYVGSWYVETFGYSREAPNIRHVLLIMPEAMASTVAPGWIFSGLTVESDSLTLREDRQEYRWALEYLYDAPGGYFKGDFEPGTYAVAAAFLAVPLSREEAGVGDDAILWAGVTGGGASTEYRTVQVEVGATAHVIFTMTDADGWACPWLYVFNGSAFERRTEILRDIRGRDHERSEITPIGPVTGADGFITIRVAEERDETTFIDMLYLMINGEPVYAESQEWWSLGLAAADGNYLVLHSGQTYDLRFPVPDSFTPGDPISIVARGYYDAPEVRH